MGTADTRREIMSSFERVFARSSSSTGGRAAPRSRTPSAPAARRPARRPTSGIYLVAKKVINAEQAQVVQSRGEQVTKTGVYAEVREDDTWIGQLLVDSGKATQTRSRSARAAGGLRREEGRGARLGEILIEEGRLISHTLQEALQRQSQLSRIACPNCGTRYVAEG
jgi:hypothetical protein